jgi:hypothetical protein
MQQNASSAAAAAVMGKQCLTMISLPSGLTGWRSCFCCFTIGRSPSKYPAQRSTRLLLQHLQTGMQAAAALAAAAVISKQLHEKRLTMISLPSVSRMTAHSFLVLTMACCKHA